MSEQGRHDLSARFYGPSSCEKPPSAIRCSRAAASWEAWSDRRMHYAAQLVYLVQNKFVEWDVTANFEVNVPGQHEGAIAVPWGGTAHPVWFKNDARVSNCRVLGGVMQRDVMLGVVQTQEMVKEKIKPLP